MGLYYRRSVSHKQMVRKPHDLCWQLSAPQSLLIFPSSSPNRMCWKTRRSKAKQQMSTVFNIQKRPLARSPVLVVSRWMCFSGLGILYRSTTALHSKQSVSKDISCHPVHSRGFCQPVCVFVCVCQSATPVYLNRMNGTLVPAGRQIMRQQLHCWHQMPLFNKRYRQSADPTSSTLTHGFSTLRMPCSCNNRWTS